MKNIVIKGLDTIDEAAKEFLQEIGDNKIIALYGSMGAGKTTFVTALCRVLGVEDVVNSPTFTIVNEYQTEEGEKCTCTPGMISRYLSKISGPLLDRMDLNINVRPVEKDLLVSGARG